MRVLWRTMMVESMEMRTTSLMVSLSSLESLDD
jgi:hypothetical protein